MICQHFTEKLFHAAGLIVGIVILRPGKGWIGVTSKADDLVLAVQSGCETKFENVLMSLYCIYRFENVTRNHRKRDENVMNAFSYFQCTPRTMPESRDVLKLAPRLCLTWRLGWRP